MIKDLLNFCRFSDGSVLIILSYMEELRSSSPIISCKG